MEVTPQLFTGKVMHSRRFPKRNHFVYSTYYVLLPLSQLGEIAALSANRRGAFSLQEREFGPRDGSALLPWCEAVLRDYALVDKVESIVLMTMPRVLGYSFNPVSFYFCLNEKGELVAVLNEVHNTFGEAHCYLCAHEDARAIAAEDILTAEKLFHVSPFLPREGEYRFRFALKEQSLGVWIDYYSAEGKLQLETALTGRLSPLTRASLRRAGRRYPLLTLKTIGLIHWQALRLFLKKIRYRVKPQQLPLHLTRSFPSTDHKKID